MPYSAERKVRHPALPQICDAAKVLLPENNDRKLPVIHLITLCVYVFPFFKKFFHCKFQHIEYYEIKSNIYSIFLI